MWDVTLGELRQQELLREAEKWHEIQRMLNKNPASHNYLRSARSQVGRALVAAGEYLAPDIEVADELRLRHKRT
jgi:hypothetical protein